MKWIRLWTREIIYGSTFNELDVSERGIWFTLLVLAGASRTSGVVEMRQGVGYEINFLAEYIQCDPVLLEKSLKKLEEVEKIKVLEDKRIEIVNWKKYQTQYDRYRKDDKEEEPPPTEYERQKKYRDSKKARYSVIKLEPHLSTKHPCSETAKKNVAGRSKCYKCGGEWDLEVHHMSCNNTDHRPENLVTVCRGHHTDIHKILNRLMKSGIYEFDYSVFWNSQSIEEVEKYAEMVTEKVTA